MTPSISETSSTHPSSKIMTSGTIFKIRERDDGEIVECKQRASIRWLVSKAYNNTPPREFRDPFYRDHNNTERLKPHLVHALANAELYCMALSHLYQDPNFHNLNNWGIIQALARKGVYVCEPNDCSLTETVLIQTGPLKMSAHMAVIDAMMSLFIKESTAAGRVQTSVNRFSKNEEDPTQAGDSLLYWVNQACQALRILLEDGKEDNKRELPKFHKVQDMADLADGIHLASVCALYSPSHFSWTEVSFASPADSGQSLRNIQLLQRFCADTLPYNCFHLSIEDMFYLHSSIRLNLECFIADLFLLFEVEPSSIVELPGVVQEKIVHFQSLDQGPKSDLAPEEEEKFFVQKGKQIPTLSSVVSSSHRSLSPGAELGRKERLNQDTKSEERGETETVSRPPSELGRDMQPAGRPSERSEVQAPRTFAGRRNRRNSSDDNQSQISIENIGGSMENISVLGRNPDKEMRVHSGRKSEVYVNTPRKGSANEQTFDVRRYFGEAEINNEVKYLDNKELDAIEKLDSGNFAHAEHLLAGSKPMNTHADKKTSFADLRKKSQTQDQFAGSGIHITYSRGEERDSVGRKVGGVDGLERNNNYHEDTVHGMQSRPEPSDVNDKLNSVRMKLEERRKRIEEEKRKTELILSRQRDVPSDSLMKNRSVLDSKSLENSPLTNYSQNKNSNVGDPYSKSLLNMNDHISEMNSNLQRLAAQQTQIQQMMQSSPQLAQQMMQSSPQLVQQIMQNSPQLMMQNSPKGPQPQQLGYASHPMKSPPPYYVASPEQPPHTPQRRTWGQPQPISFPQNPELGYDRYGWGRQMPPLHPQQNIYEEVGPGPMYDNYGMQGMHRDQWGNIVPPSPSSYGNSHGGGYMYQSSPQYHPPQYPPNDPYSPQYMSPYGTMNSAHSNNLGLNNPALSPVKGTPFRLHMSSGMNLESSPSPSNPEPMRNHSRDFPDLSTLAITPVRKMHAPVPAPAMDDMAPQNISFIESSSDIEEKLSLSPLPRKRLSKDEDDGGGYGSEKINRFPFQSKDKTYRLQLHADGREPTEVMPEPSTPVLTPKNSRSTISSSFKERRRGSNESSSGPLSLGSQNPNVNMIQSKLTDEEIETLNNMKTEVLSETTDPAKGFVISFDDETNVKPKPVLKDRKFSKRNSKDHNFSSDPVMIMLDMNEDIDSDNRDSSPTRKPVPLKSKPKEGGGHYWNSYDSDDLLSPSDVVPKFTVDPNIPLEPMAEFNDASDSDSAKATRLIIGDQMLIMGETTGFDMAKKKEKIIMQSLQRKQQAESNRQKREEEARVKKEEAAWKAEEAQRKKEEDSRRKEAILEAHKFKKEQEKAEEEGRHFPSPIAAKPIPKIRNNGTKKPRPKTMLIEKSDSSGMGGRKLVGSVSNLSNSRSSTTDLRRSESRGSLVDHGERPQSSRSTISLSLMGSRPPMGSSRLNSSKRDLRTDSSPYSTNEDKGTLLRSSRVDRSARSASQPRGKRDSSVSSAYGPNEKGLRNDSFRGSRDSLISRRTYTARRGSNSSLFEDDDDFYYSGSLKDLTYGGHKGRRKSSSTSYLGPGSLPSRNRRVGDFDDAISDVSSASGWSACGYRSGGSRLGMYREPSTKSNRPIVMNAIEHVVFPGVVNKETRMRVLEEIDACDCPHFLILFRDTKCQFRGLYAYYPDTEEVFKIYGTGPKVITDKMFERFFKYNSGGKKFTQIHTKSLTVTIDAFTMHNSLWLGKRPKLPDKRDMALVV